ncbi:Fe-S oxidoreductase [Desulfacinum hydrothermale DSM 13146]|uniref:Fe-S oxidoreductase n=1 Tax=Desulfacinum hydrothermale DSM 13146 TaxID=1121390 RepID=A0A1W1XM72_9BACT|nr:radical SAM protein [Desulfacinum hydrothermale]SMC24954.1 Fe-S oxidoreductase [Desulfacinum hydrothermale DSM 13146]
MDGLHYEGMIIRPPSEADSIILQITRGCSHNKCTFCGTYKGVRFGIKDEAIVDRDIDYAAKNLQFLRRVFLADGDALILPQERLVRLLQKIRTRMPWIQRVGLYGNAKSILRKSLQQLKELRDLGLGIVYLGVESGDPQTLRDIRKGVSREKMVEAGRRVRQAGIKLSVTVLLGIAGRERSLEHARATGSILSEIDPHYVGALTLMVLPNTELGRRVQEGTFEVLDPRELLVELREMLAHTHMSRGLFLSNHASNYLPIKVKMPTDKERALALIDEALKGRVRLKPEWMRAL